MARWATPELKRRLARDRARGAGVAALAREHGYSRSGIYRLLSTRELRDLIREELEHLRQRDRRPSALPERELTLARRAPSTRPRSWWSWGKRLTTKRHP